MADARIVRGVLAGLPVDAAALAEVVAALAAKDASRLSELAASFPAASRDALLRLTTLYGSEEVLDIARRELPRRALIDAALDDLRWLAERLRRSHPEVDIGFDLADLRGYAYYSGARFAVYVAGASDAVVRGGRYDEVGAVFGRNRPAVGFSMDLKVCRRDWPTHRRRAPRFARRGATMRRSARPCGACASRARRWSACCPATGMRRRNSTATASWWRAPGSGSCARL